ncbi:MAG: BlaI/MecI/CopY family transcriptional regulator [Candidatus Melainabacteria bacterium]|nr:BlaI/MecI/CopY family transcriptional regulator [Candidatus Melainabacteria bacterium]
MDLKQGDLENIILNALWDLEGEGSEQIFVGDVQEKIKSPSKKWAYTTVKTVLDRLVDKEIALREKHGKKYLYRSVMNRDDAGVLAIHKVLRQYFKNDTNEMLGCLQRIREEAVLGAAAAVRPQPSLERERQRAQQQQAEIAQRELVHR